MHTAPSVHAELLGCVQCGGTTAQTCGSTRRVLPQVTARGSHTVHPHSSMMSLECYCPQQSSEEVR